MRLPPHLTYLVPALGAFLLAWLAWVAGGWAVDMARLGELDLPARVCAVFFALGLGEAVVARFPLNTEK